MRENTTGQCLGFRATLSLLHHHRMLATRRNVLSGEGKAAKIFIWVMTAMAVVYLAFVGLMMAFILVDDKSVNAYEFTSGIVPFVMVADFIFLVCLPEDAGTRSEAISSFAIVEVFLYRLSSYRRSSESVQSPASGFLPANRSHHCAPTLRARSFIRFPPCITTRH